MNVHLSIQNNTMDGSNLRCCQCNNSNQTHIARHKKFRNTCGQIFASFF